MGFEVEFLDDSPSDIPKIITFKCKTNFDLSPYLISDGVVRIDEDINEPPEIRLTIGYNDGSIRNFVCDNRKYRHERRTHDHSLIIDGDTITYYLPMNITEEDSKLTCACIFSNVKEVYLGN